MLGVHFETGTISQTPYVMAEDVERTALPPGYKVNLLKNWSLTSHLIDVILQWKENAITKQKYIQNGLYGDIWNILQKTLNFSYSMVSSLTKQN